MEAERIERERIEQQFPEGTEDIPNEFQDAEPLRYDDGEPLLPDQRDEG